MTDQELELADRMALGVCRTLARLPGPSFEDAAEAWATAQQLATPESPAHDEAVLLAEIHEAIAFLQSVGTDLKDEEQGAPRAAPPPIEILVEGHPV